VISATGYQALSYRLAEQVEQLACYQLQEGQIELTPAPGWIRRNLGREVLRQQQARLPRSLLSPGAAEQIAAAFTAHPWIAEVREVRIWYPGKVFVAVHYRRPVCMVYVPGGLIPIDGEGVILPPEDFSTWEANEFLILRGIERLPEACVGHRWTDGRVLLGAQLAALVGETARTTGIRFMIPRCSPNPLGIDDTQFELLTDSGTTIVWGHPPKMEIGPEPPAADKLAFLQWYYREYGTFDGPTGAHRLDLTRGPLVIPR